MKKATYNKITVAGTTKSGRLGLFLAASLFAPLVSLQAAPPGYLQMNLVSDLAGAAQLQDTNLVNAWGISFSSSSPFWVSANGTGKALLYAVTNDASGNPTVVKQGLEVNIPGEGNPTGQVFNNVGGFNGDNFLFVSEDGTVSGWRGALGVNAEVLNVRTGAVYKGVTLAMGSNGPLLLAANFAEGTIDAYGTNAALVAQYADSRAPSGYAPFNVQRMGSLVVVTFAKQDAEKHDDVPGTGHGLIDIFNPMTGAFIRFATGSDAGGKLRDIDSPWGVVVAPASFGRHGDQLLVGNFGSGTIMSFDARGRFTGVLKNEHGHSLTIDGLWGLTVGNGGRGGSANTVYFSAGPNGEGDGLFGSLTPTR